MTHYLLRETAEAHEPLQQWLTTCNDTGATTAGLLVYRNNVMHSLSTALLAQYPAVSALVGTDFSAALARDYIRAFPADNPVLAFYGEHMAAFIKQHHACVSLPWLADVARLEWLCQNALHAADDELLATQDLLQLDTELLGAVNLQLHSSAVLFTSQWPVHDIRNESLQADPQTVALDQKQKAQLLIYRKGWDVEVVALQAAPFLLLSALQQGSTLETSWHLVQKQISIPDEELIPILVYLLQLDVFSAFSVVADSIHTAIHPNGATS